MEAKYVSVCMVWLVVATAGMYCNPVRSLSAQQETFQAVYVDQFRLTYFRQLLAKSYNNSAAVREIIDADHSGFTEPVLTAEDHKFIDSLTTTGNEILKTDSLEGSRRAEGAQGKRPLGFISAKLSGNWLDSLARQRWKANGKPGVEKQ